MNLNIGCGHSKLGEGWVNLDRNQDVEPEVVFDLEKCLEPFDEEDYSCNTSSTMMKGVPDTKVFRLPFDDDTFEKIYASHILEHIVRILPLVQELWRVAAPQCSFVARVPYGSHDSAFEDPTHVRQFFLQSFSYFSQPAYGGADYGYRGDWDVSNRILHVRRDKLLPGEEEDLEKLLARVHRERNLVEEYIVEMKAVKPARDPRKPGQILKAPVSFDFI